MFEGQDHEVANIAIGQEFPDKTLEVVGDFDEDEMPTQWVQLVCHVGDLVSILLRL